MRSLFFYPRMGGGAFVSVKIMCVTKGSLAETLGILPGDVLLSINEK